MELFNLIYALEDYTDAKVTKVKAIASDKYSSGLFLASVKKLGGQNALYLFNDVVLVKYSKNAAQDYSRIWQNQIFKSIFKPECKRLYATQIANMHDDGAPQVNLGKAEAIFSENGESNQTLYEAL